MDYNRAIFCASSKSSGFPRSSRRRRQEMGLGEEQGPAIASPWAPER